MSEEGYSLSLKNLYPSPGFLPGALRGESASFGDEVLETPDIGTMGAEFNCRLLAIFDQVDCFLCLIEGIP